MGRKRQTALPFFLDPDGSFFSEEVQRVLTKAARTLNESKAADSLFFPIAAYASTYELATSTKPAKHTEWVYLYQRAPEFVAALLNAVTKHRPGGSLADDVAAVEGQLTGDCDPTSGTDEGRALPTFDEIAARISRPRITGERIRQKEHYELAKRRREILKNWQRPFAAWQDHLFVTAKGRSN